VTLVIEKRWTWKGDDYASGRIENPRIDIDKLSLSPLPLRGGELVDLRAVSEPYRRPDPYAELWRKLTAKKPCRARDGPDPMGTIPEPVTRRIRHARPRSAQEQAITSASANF
jgi:hypothetical protein